MAYEDEGIEIGKAKRSKAGSLKIRTSKSSSGSGKESKPEAVVKITSWAKSSASVKKMLDYIAREKEPGEEEKTLGELETELKERLAKGDFKNDEERSKAEFLLELCGLQKEYLERITEINLIRQQEFKELKKDANGKPDWDKIKELNEKFEKKHADNLTYAKTHIWNMQKVHGIDMNYAMRLNKAYSTHNEVKQRISIQSAELMKEKGGIAEDKRASFAAKHRRNAETLDSAVFETANQMGLPLDVIKAREEAKAARKHPKALKGEILQLEDDLGIHYKGAFQVQMLFDNWAKDFERNRKGKLATRHAVHIALSAKSENTPPNLEAVRGAARATARKHFGDKGYEFALGIHQDGNYPHAHLIVKCKNKETGKQLALDPKNLIQIRKTFARELSVRGLAHVATRPKDRPRAAKKTKERASNWDKDNMQTLLKSTHALVKNLEKEQKTFARKLTRKTPKVDAFKFRNAQARSLETQRAKIKEIPKQQDKIKTLEIEIEEIKKVAVPGWDEHQKRMELETELIKLKQEDKERMEAFNTLRSFKRETEKSQNMEIETKATFNQMAKDLQDWKKAVKNLEIHAPRQELNRDQATDLKKSRDLLQKKGGELMDRVDNFNMKLKTIKLPVEVKKELYKDLREQSREVKERRIKSKGIEWGFEKKKEPTKSKGRSR